MSSEQQQVDKKLWGCFLALRRCWRKRRGLGRTRLPCLVSSSLLQGLMHCHLYGEQWRWWQRWPTLSSRGSASSL